MMNYEINSVIKRQLSSEKIRKRDISAHDWAIRFINTYFTDDGKAIVFGKGFE